MTIYVFVLKGDLNGKIVVVRFFFFVGYILSLKPKGKCDCTNVIHFSSVSCLFIFCNLDDEFGSNIIFFQMGEFKLY